MIFGAQPGLSKTIKPSRKRRRWLGKAVLIALVFGVAYYQIRGYVRQPQAVLVLGGATEREVFAVQFAMAHPDLPIWISSGSNPEYSQWIFSEAGIDMSRLHLDYRAKDTVTNFTTLVDDFQAQGINSIYLITSDYHMRRASVIGEIVLGSRDIDFKPIPVPSDEAAEPTEKVIRDAARSLLWLTTGHTGSSLGQRLLGKSL